MVSAIEVDSGEILMENKLLHGYINLSKEHRGVGHVFFSDPDDGTQFIRWRANEAFKNAITNETTKIILLKVIKKEKKDQDGNLIPYYFIKENVVTNEEGSSFLKT